MDRPEGFSKPSVTTGAYLSQRLSPGIVERGAVANLNYDAGARVLNNRKSSSRVEKGEGLKSHLVHHYRTTRSFGSTTGSIGIAIVNFDDEGRISRNEVTDAQNQVVMHRLCLAKTPQPLIVTADQSIILLTAGEIQIQSLSQRGDCDYLHDITAFVCNRPFRLCL
ncbi:uncharacterized protein BDV14DRAFT_153428 [Aspergillus stella-maris]|uniref:uncharacterized protein n=1 Tax=Aspergillus stella-maris TaxID=1810926 RepID=UPI003CCD001E